MADDLDDLIRRAMKTLDSQVPSGYFEALPKQTLARLEGSMQTTGSTESEQASGVPPVNEDSGLHDIRNLAQSTKQRLSSKRISTSPVATDEEILAASSAGWKAAVALPEPAKMVSLPSIDELPSKQEVRAKEKAAEKAAAAGAAPAVEVRQPFSQFARPTAPKKSKGGVFAIVGVMAAAAAGVGIYFYTQNQSAPATGKASERAETVAIAQTPPPAPAPTAAPAPAPAPPTVQPIEEAPPAQAAEPAKDDNAAADKIAAPPTKPTPPSKHVMTKGGKAKAEVQKTETKVEETKPTPPPDNAKTGKKTAGKGDEQDPDFDQLLKEAGVDQTKKVQKPVLAKKELSSDDFKKGMAAIAAKAQACYKGTQGTVTFKVNVAPTGRISKVTVTGAFAGKPEGECVQGAVQGASFPAWDGAPQSFTYSYLLAE